MFGGYGHDDLEAKGPPGEHAVHIHAAGKCDAPSFESAGPHFNSGKEHHGMMAGHGHAGDMPNIIVPKDGMLTVEVLNTAVTLDKGKPNSLFGGDGTALVIHAGKDDYKNDPAGNAGARLDCGVNTEVPEATISGARRNAEAAAAAAIIAIVKAKATTDARALRLRSSLSV